MKKNFFYLFAFSTIITFGDFTIISFFRDQNFETLPSYLYKLISVYRFEEAAFIAAFILFISMLMYFIIDNFNYNVIIANFDHSSAYGWKGNLMIELICDHSQISKKSITKGMHHIAWIAKDFDKESKELIKQDCKEVLFARAGDRNGMKYIIKKMMR